MEILHHVGPEIWNNYYKFTFVRNPWDLLVSKYHWCLKTNWDDDRNTIKRIKELEDFEEYLYSPYVYKKDCIDSISDGKGNIVIDYVGKTELNNWDIEKIYRAIGIYPQKPGRNSTSIHEKYFRYYNPISRELVRGWYDRDIRKFDYEYKNIQRHLEPKNIKNKYPRKKWLILHSSCYEYDDTLFESIIKNVCVRFNWKCETGNSNKLLPDACTDIFLQYQAGIDFSMLPPYVGTHLIRDPRDMIISGYFYHLCCEELWCNMPVQEFDGKSYQQVLNSLNREDGILFEMTSPRGAFKNTASRMLNWNYQNQYILELKYEEIIQDMEKHFLQIFTHYGFNASETEIAMEVVDQYRFEKIAGRTRGDEVLNSHFRKVVSGDWKNHFTESHKKAFKELYPGLLEKLGYEENDLW
jgi:hypothetical protein